MVWRKRSLLTAHTRQQGFAQSSGEGKLSTDGDPMVTVVMPVKGVKEHSEGNWHTQLATSYKGPVEFVFVVESRQDPAYRVLVQLIEYYQSCAGALRSRHSSEKKPAGTSQLRCQVSDTKTLTLSVAGAANTCSQKLHNMLHGISVANLESAYTLFLDDDVTLHHKMIKHLVRS